MLVYVQADEKTYRLGDDLTTWVEFTSGVSSWNDLDDRPTEFPPSAHQHQISDVTNLSDALSEKLPLAGGAMNAAASITLSDATSDSEVAGWGFGVQVTEDKSQYAYVEPTGFYVHGGGSSTLITPAGITLHNQTQLVKGSFDNSTGGANGISLICAVGYELNWQGGRLRNVQINGDGTPQPIFCDSTIEFAGEDGSITITGDGIIFPDGTQTVAWTGSLSWEDISGKPSEFSPSAHASAHQPGGSDAVYDQSLNTTDNVSFRSVVVDTSDTDPTVLVTARDPGDDSVLDTAYIGVRSSVAAAFVQSLHGWLRVEKGGGDLGGLVVETVRFVDATEQTTAWTGTVDAANVTGLATVATSGSYDDLDDKPTIPPEFTLLTATSSVLGGVKIGSGVTITDGVISVSTSYAAASHTHAASDIASGTLDAARLPTVLERTVTVGNSGTSTTLSLANGSVQTVTLNGNCTFTMPAAAAGASLTLILTQGGTNTATFTGVLWPGGTAPTITATANKVDILVFVSNGTSWFGTASQNH
jgi:hypothetical protein